MSTLVVASEKAVRVILGVEGFAARKAAEDARRSR